MSPEEWLALQPPESAPSVQSKPSFSSPTPTAPMSPEQWLAAQGPSQLVDSLAGVSKDLGKVEFVDRLGGGFRDAPQPPGFLGGLIEGAKDVARDVREAVTGTRRSAAPDVAAALAENRTIYDMPEANQLSFGMLKSALGGLTAGSEERAKIFAANFPGLTYRLDENGTVFLKSPTDGKEYVIEPGLTAEDLVKAAAVGVAFTPAGRAVSIPAAIMAGGLTQSALEMGQEAAGGEYNMGEVLAAAAMGPAGQILQRAGTGLKNIVQNLRGKVPPVIASGVRSGVPTVATNIPAATNIPVDSLARVPRDLPPIEFVDNLSGGFRDAPRVVPTATPIPADKINQESIKPLIQKAAGTGPGSTGARKKVAELARINLADKEAADMLGIDLPADVFSDSPQIRSAAGLTRSVAGSETEAAWRTTVSQAVEKADDVIRQFDAQFIEGTVAPAVVSQKIKDSLIREQKELVEQAKSLYEAVDLEVPEQTIVKFPALKEKMAEITSRLGKKGVQKNATLKMLNKLIRDANAGEVPYGRLKEEKTLIGDSIKGVQNDYSKSTSQGRLKEIYGALAKDQLDNVERLAGAEVRKQLRSANLLTAKEKALGNRIVKAFGEDIEGGLGSKLKAAIISAGKGDTGVFNRLLRIVPEEYRKETLATALAAATRSGRGAEKGGFGFSEFATIYPKLRANPGVYKNIIDTLGKDSANVLNALFVVSKRLTEARANVLTTGKANQAFLNPEGLVGKVINSSIAQRAATAVAGVVPGGGVFAPDIIKFMSQGPEDRVKAAGKLFADEAFQNLLIESATKVTPSASALRRAALSKSFREFAAAVKLPKTLDARIQWLQSAMQAERQLSPDEQPEPKPQPVGQ